MSSIFVNSYSHKFTPYSVPGLRAWFDARFGVYSALAIPDSSATVNGTGFPVNFSNSTIQIVNGIVGYSTRSNFTTTYGVAKFGSVWKYVSTYTGYSEDSGSIPFPFEVYTPEIVAIGDTQYPWQATWPSGISVTRNGSALNTKATFNQNVRAWENRLNPDEFFSQSTINVQPVFLYNDVYFNGFNALQYIPKNTTSILYNSIQYYIAFRGLDATNYPGGTIIRAGASTTSRSQHRFATQISPDSKILVNHSNTSYLDSQVTYGDSFGMYNRIYSIEFFNNGVTVWVKVYNNIYSNADPIFVGPVSSMQTRFLLGASTTTGSQGIYGSISHVLIYYTTQTQEQRVKIMRYLKDNINNEHPTEIEL